MLMLMACTCAYMLYTHTRTRAGEHCAEGVVAIAGSSLRIISLDKLDDAFNAEKIPLRYTPRRMAAHSVSGNLVIVEADHNAYNEDEKAELYEALGVTPPLPAGTPVPEDEETEGLIMESSIGVPRAQPGKWAPRARLLTLALARALTPNRQAALARAAAHPSPNPNPSR